MQYDDFRRSDNIEDRRGDEAPMGIPGVSSGGIGIGGLIIVGLISGSLGILAEAAHSALDLVAALVTYFAIHASDKPADRVHHYGHGKIENLSALFETLLLFVTCAWISYEAVEQCIRSAASDLLRDLILFDVYTGQNIEIGRKSLALGLILQSSSQTLTDEIIDATVGRILERLTAELDARLRD